MTGRDVGRPITVGVANQQHGALAYAAEEARLAGCDLRVVHAYVVPPSPPQMMGTAYGFDIDASFRESGRRVLTDATDLLASRCAGMTVHPVLTRGTATTVLSDTSATSRLLVLGPDDATPWYSRLFQSRVSRALIADAGCPVVVVPDTWTARAPARGVTLLLDSETVAHGPLRFAFEHASRHHQVLHVVHVRASGDAEHPAVPWPDMHRLIDSWRATYPHVWVDTRVVTGAADPATIGGFERTALLVLGRPHARHVVAALHPSLARSVIEHADCPVVVVPPDYDA